MDTYTTRGFNPLSGLDIKKAVCGSLYQEMDKHDFLGQHLAYPVVKWKVTVQLELASSAKAQSDKIQMATATGYEQTDDQGVPVEAGVSTVETIETSHEVEFPDLTREQFIGEDKPKEPESANVAVAPTKAGVESYPEKFKN
jgi:hypothetical protein